MKFDKIGLNEIHPSEYNPRSISENELNKLSNNLEEFGLVDPIIIDLSDNNTIVGGHQRYKALQQKYGESKELNLIRLGDVGWIFDESELKIKDKDHQKALNVSLNKIQGGWDYNKLGNLFSSLSADFNINLTGFDDVELSHFEIQPVETLNESFTEKYVDLQESSEQMGYEDSVEDEYYDYDNAENISEPAKISESTTLNDKNDEFFYFEREEIKQDLIDGWDVPENLEDFIKQIITLPVAKYQFNRLCQGYKDGYNISLLFNSHRFTTPTRKPMPLFEALHDDYTIKDMCRYISGYTKVFPPTQLYRYIQANSGKFQYVGEFHPYTARNIYKKFTKDGDKILNPCAGWGGRLIGLASLCYQKIEYVETDTNPETVEGLNKLKNFLRLDKEMYVTYNEPIEELELRENYFDFAFTSPPYFNTELYGGEKSSHALNSTYDEWEKNFLFKMLDKIHYSLKDGANCLLNISKKYYPIDESIISYMVDKYGVETAITTEFSLAKHGIGKRTEGNELFLLFKK